jgi:YHS domain-containing protein
MCESPKRLACDPVCGREPTEEQAQLSAEVNGDRYLLCSERCRMVFSIRPDWFLEPTDPRPARRVS